MNPSTAPVSVDVTVSAYGCQQGVFDVDSSGQAVFSIPLVVPPGIAGLQPELGLIYNHRQANGVLGVGWSLAGLSSISRVKANYAVDGFNGAVAYDAQDRFAIDGARLINVSGQYGAAGTVYHTEMESWRHVRAGATLQEGFIVTQKNGHIWRYGATTDSRIMALNGTQVRVWALSSIEDMFGNQIQYHYSATPVAGVAASGAYYLTQISYTHRSNVQANRFVQFEYEARTDKIVSYVGGFQLSTLCRLSQISTMLDANTLVRSWHLNYAYSPVTTASRLISINESGAALAASLPPVQLGWQGAQATAFDIGVNSQLEQHLNTEDIQMMDVSGNGKTDIVQLWRDQNGLLNATVYLATEIAGKVSFVRASNTNLGSFPSPRQILPVNLSGSGRTDLLIVYQDSASKLMKLQGFISNGSSFDALAVFNTGDPWSNGHISFFAMDVNGDGRTDLVEAYTRTDASGKWLTFRTYFSLLGDGPGKLFSQALVSTTQDPAVLTNPLAFWPMDVNGDGMMDLVRVWQDGAQGKVYAKTYLAVSHALNDVRFVENKKSDLGSFSFANQLAFLPADVNGDGNMDLLQIWKEPNASGSTTLHLTTFLSDGAGGFVPGPDSSFKDQTFATNGFYPMGFNGGGQTNLLSRWVSGSNELMFTLFSSSPSGEFSVAGAPVKAGAVGVNNQNARFLIGDVNGNGKADLVRIMADQNNLPLATPYLSAGAYPDLINAITDQLGLVTEVQYAPLSDANVYSHALTEGYPSATGLRYSNQLAPAQFPVQAVLGQALYVVAQYTQSNLATQNRFSCAQQFKINYANAQINLLGRGWQGFATVSKLNLLTGQGQLQSFNQEFPLSGTLASLDVFANGKYSSDPRVPKDASDVLMSRTINSYQSYVRAHGASSGTPSQTVWEVLPVASQSNHYDYGKERLDYAIKKTFDYDQYGNLSRNFYLGYVNPDTGVMLYPEQAVYRYNSYQNEVSANGWALGYLLYAKTSSNREDSKIDQFLLGDYRLEKNTYLAKIWALDSQSQWDSRNKIYLSKRYQYDVYGNCSAEIAPGELLTQYVYESTYHCYLMRTILPANAQNISLQKQHGFDPRFGVEVASQNENGDVSIYALDPFGRQQLYQGPLPDDVKQSDTNSLTALVTGSPDLLKVFREARVLTLASTSYTNDGVGGIYTEVAKLQSFPQTAQRDFLKTRDYCDALARTTQTVTLSANSTRNAVTLTVYDANGQPARKSMPFFAQNLQNPQASCWSSFSYDVLTRPLTQSTPIGNDGKGISKTSWLYNAGGVVTQTTADGTEIAFVQQYFKHFFDSKDCCVNSVIVSDNNATTVFVYDALARLLSSTDPKTISNPNGVTTSSRYDSLDRKISVDTPDHNATGNPAIQAANYQYDAQTGRLIQQTDAMQLSIITSYDQLGRMVRQVLNNSRVINYQYDDAASKSNGYLYQVTITKDDVLESQRTYAYDPYGNRISDLLEVADKSYLTQSVFDPQARLVQRKLPDNALIQLTFQEGQLVQQNIGSTKLSYPLAEYTAAGQFGRIVYGQGGMSGGVMYSQYDFSPAGTLYGESFNSSRGGQIVQMAYEYDALEQLTQITDSVAASEQHLQRFFYRCRRLSASILPGFANAKYEYDASGNIIEKDGLQYTYEAHFPLRMQRTDESFYSATRDPCGRTLSRTRNNKRIHFYYDVLGALQRVTAENGVTNLFEYVNDQYGAHIMRINKVSGLQTIYVNPNLQVSIDGEQVSYTKFLFDSKGCAATLTTGASLTSAPRYLRRDHKGDVTHVFDGIGVLLTQLAYDAYGLCKTVSGDGKVLPKYESREWDDDIGLYDFGARMYDPLTARFLTPDSQLGASSMLQMDAWNSFAFELNCPINHIDPNGHMPAWIGGLLIGLAAVVAGLAIIATGGAATPLAAAGVGVLIGAGASAVGYSTSHQDDFSWKDFAIQSAISGAIGGLSGGALSGLSGAIAASANPVLWGSVSGALISSAGDVLGTLASNAATGADLSNGLAAAAITGFAFGAVGGAAGGKLLAAEKNASTALATAEKQFQNATFRLVPLNTVPEHVATVTAARSSFAVTSKAINGISATVTGSAVPQAYLESLD